MLKNILIFFLLTSTILYGRLDLDFSVHKLGNGKGNTLLIIGGIQGDEPGGFTAASLIATKYKITNGNVWVVPNLAFESIIKRSRGVYGDLNRKFANLKKSDPDYETIQRIKKLIINDEVDVIVNLHDGSGFYRKKYVNKMKNPNRWGQCSIIDQEKMDGVKFGNLQEISEKVVENVNKYSINKEYNYLVNNTKTGEGNQEMAKTLTWYAVKNNKPAFGNEASKSFRTHTRAFYHLLAVEGFMKYLDIEFERDFKLTPRQVRAEINNDVKVAMNEKIVLDVVGSRNWINYLPLQKGSKVKASSTNPLTAVVSNGKNYRIHYGNRRMSYIAPQYFDYDTSIKSFDFMVDGQKKTVDFGSHVNVYNNFMVEPKKGYRVNVIGFSKRNIKNESGIKVTKRDVVKRFSVDKKGTTYRVEVYKEKENKFAGMVLVKFQDRKTYASSSIPSSIKNN
ncbi:MAG: deacylase [Campylobacterales bacterium]|nr:deacylase [Campylobacterales bacterium]